MSTTLALIHTSPVLVPSFTSLCAQFLPESPVFHMVDESLIKNTIAAGSLQKTTIRRLVGHIDSAAQAGAGVVLVTCSSIGEGVRVARELFDFPVLRIDEPMAERAVDAGRRIGVLATLQTTLAPTVRLLKDDRGLERLSSRDRLLPLRGGLRCGARGRRRDARPDRRGEPARAERLGRRDRAGAGVDGPRRREPPAGGSNDPDPLQPGAGRGTGGGGDGRERPQQRGRSRLHAGTGGEGPRR